MKDLLKACETAINVSKDADVEAYAAHGVSRAVRIEKNDIHLATSEEASSIGVRVFKDKALGFASNNTLDEKSVSATAAEALAIAGASRPDDANVLSEKSDYPEVPGLYDPAVEKVEISHVLEYARDLLAAARDYDSRVMIDGGSVSVGVTRRAIMNSRGVEASETSGVIVYQLMGMARDGDDVSTFQFEFDVNRSPGDVNVKKVGRDLAEKLIATLGAGKGESFKGTVILTPDSLGALLCSPIFFSASAENVQKGRSRWKDKAGEKVASELITVYDDGLIPGGMGSSAFDREGVPHGKFTVIENGRLGGYMYDTRTAHRDGVKSTGHAAGGTRGVPGIGPTNVTVAPGERSIDEIIGEIELGIIVNRFSGWPNPISGDFSGVVKGGFLIKDGKKDRPLTGTLVQGNMYEAMNNVSAVSKETRRIFNYTLPHVRVEGLSVTSA